MKRFSRCKIEQIRRSLPPGVALEHQHLGPKQTFFKATTEKNCDFSIQPLIRGVGCETTLALHAVLPAVLE